MKKLLIFLSCCLIPLIMACDCNGPYRKRMLNYYSNDSNYAELNGTIVQIQNDHTLEIKILTEGHNFPTYNEGYQVFGLYTSSVNDYDITEGDNITFISAPDYFYDGHQLPIVALSKSEEQYLSFESGKNEYLRWIQEEF